MTEALELVGMFAVVVIAAWSILAIFAFPLWVYRKWLYRGDE